MEIDTVIKSLEASVAPCLLISGFGFLLLTMTNRLGRASDRIRILHEKINGLSREEKDNTCHQIKILFRRCQYLQSAIALLVFSIFFVSLNVLLLFSTLLFPINTNILIEIFFATSLICLIISLFYFLLDIRITLKSLRIEMGEHIK